MGNVFFDLSYDDHYKCVSFVSGKNKWESIICPKYDGHQHPGKRIGNIHVKIVDKKERDFYWTYLSELLITEKVVKIFSENNITGFSLSPVVVYNNTLELKLWHLKKEGWGGVAPEKSGISLLKNESCEFCGSLIYSAYTNPEYIIDEKQWDGSDIFLVWPLPAYYFVTTRVVEVVNKYNLKGAVFIETSKLSRPDYLPNTLSPGRLSYFFPEEKAKEIGEPLGVY